MTSKVAIGKAHAAVGMGAVGVTGDLPNNDEAIAIADIESAGLSYNTGE